MCTSTLIVAIIPDQGFLVLCTLRARQASDPWRVLFHVCYILCTSHQHRIHLCNLSGTQLLTLHDISTCACTTVVYIIKVYVVHIIHVYVCRWRRQMCTKCLHWAATTRGTGPWRTWRRRGGREGGPWRILTWGIEVLWGTGRGSQVCWHTHTHTHTHTLTHTYHRHAFTPCVIPLDPLIKHLIAFQSLVEEYHSIYMYTCGVVTCPSCDYHVTESLLKQAESLSGGGTKPVKHGPLTQRLMAVSGLHYTVYVYL